MSSLFSIRYSLPVFLFFPALFPTIQPAFFVFTVVVAERNTNANAESFNAKIKLFRANLRGVSDNTFFLVFRVAKLFA
jgi:hypothetical protein